MKKVATFSLVLILMLSTFICAEEVSSEIVYNQGDISVDAGVDYVTKYFFRGILVEDDGYIIQPYAQINFHVVSGCDVEVTLFGGVWASIHGEDITNQVANDPEGLNELRLIGGMALDLYDLLTVTTRYTVYTFPNDSDAGINQDRVDDRHEISVEVRINDGAILGGNFSINPWMLFAYELQDGNPNADNEGDESAFILTGIEPTIAIEIAEGSNLLLSLPVTVGFGANNNAYVDDENDGETFGYVSVGAKAVVPLTFIPKRFGDWNVSAGVDVYFLGNAAEDKNLEGDNNNNGEGEGEEFDIVGTFGLNINY
ncbi:hypothetical protein [Candidatus Uabimicrobium sp. HlEnr_7]|uniref:hypothetical protein n=1 Tax=Candidatus Uabimicrobium helgolandensis TaxID=3095367 RepID=UPI0035585EA9